jgi:OOP family OmpA-OmpF porin
MKSSVRRASFQAFSRLLGALAVAVALLTCAASSTAWAQREEPLVDDSGPIGNRDFRFDFGLFAGGHFYAAKHALGRDQQDSADLSPASGLVLGGRLGLVFNRWVTLEFEGSASPTKTRNGATNVFVVGYRGNFVVHLSESYAFRPFLLVGYGGLTSIVNDEAQVQNGMKVTPEGDIDGFLHAGIGFKIGFGDRAGLRVDGRIMGPPAFASSILPVGGETGFDGPDFEVLGGFFVQFGEVPRSKIVFTPVTMPPPVAAPPADPDGDGIAGKTDGCPNVAEDKDGFEDIDGCPEVDNDGDGVPDPQDQCPLKPELKNGIDDDDGCPEEDTDGDGFIGSRDKCPDAPETKNNYQDNDGCPDEIPAAVKKFTGVIEGINFKTASADILSGSYAILDRAVKVLKEYPDVSLEISGHTDSRGAADYNRDLSQRRADAVKAFLVSQGIEAKRLTSIGFGEDRPLADNASESGRAKNRRTEFRLIGSGEP